MSDRYVVETKTLGISSIVLGTEPFTETRSYRWLWLAKLIVLLDNAAPALGGCIMMSRLIQSPMADAPN